MSPPHATEHPPGRRNGAIRDRAKLIAWIVLGIIVAVLLVQHANKVRKDRSAFVRWRVQIHELVAGGNVYQGDLEQGRDDEEELGPYPNPPLMAILLYPLAVLPKVAGAILWFLLKVLMAILAFHWSLRLAAGEQERVPIWAAAVALLLSVRMIVSDLQHGNVNILIAFLVIAGLWAFANHRDILAGMLLALATTLKVTPALFIPYFAYKRQWRLVAWTLAGLVLFFLVVPGLIIGPAHNINMLGEWYRAMIEPYLMRGYVETLQINQSMPGLLHRLLTDSIGIKFSDGVFGRVNVASLPRETVGWVVKGISLIVIAWLALLCRTPIRRAGRRDWRLACEYGLVLLAMLLLSERSWKHHYVIMILPLCSVAAYAALPTRAGYSRPFAMAMLGLLGLAMLLMMSTSKEMTGWLAQDGMGHKYAQAYNTFMFAGVAVFIALSAILLRARARSDRPSSA